MKFQLAILVACAAVSSLHLEGASAEHRQRSLVSDLLQRISTALGGATSQVTTTLQELENATNSVQDSLEAKTQDLVQKTLKDIIERVEQLSGTPQGDFINCTEVQNFTRSVSNQIATLGSTCTDEALSVTNSLQEQLENLLNNVRKQFQQASDDSKNCGLLDFECILNLPAEITQILANVAKDVNSITGLVETAAIEGNPVSIVANGAACLTKGVVSVSTEASKLLPIVNSCLATTTTTTTTTTTENTNTEDTNTEDTNTEDTNTEDTNTAATS